MDQIQQLQRQILGLRNEINNISQVASQLQQAEANNAAQLQRLHQHETVASQQLNAIQQLCQHLNQDVNAISNATQQVTTQMLTRPTTTGQFGTTTPNISSLHNPDQFGTFGAQFTPSYLRTTQQGQGFAHDFNQAQKFTAMPYTSSMIPGSNVGTPWANINPFSSTSSMIPSQQQFGTSSMMPLQGSQQFGTSSMSGNIAPFVTSHVSSMPSSSLQSSSRVPLSTPQNMSFSSL
ncbi:MAG: hypothetical protein HQP61_07995 [Peptococcaceae bacterium]|nr:hypothetical protein [Candidatus Syntrophopropionicum ammoniitolerans]